MASLLSRISEKISNAQFQSPPSGRVVKAKRVFRDHDTAVVELANGSFFACRPTQYTGAKAFVARPADSWLIKALHAFGVITDEERDEHNREIHRRYADHDKKYHRDHLIDLSKKYGFKITAEQKKKLGIDE